MSNLHPSSCKDQLIRALALDDFTPIYDKARCTCMQYKGDEIQIRAILEFSNYCRRHCAYCGLNAENTALRRYRMAPDEIVEKCREAWQVGYRTVVLQSGEDPYYTPAILGEIVKEIKRTGIFVTLSCGEMSYDDYRYLKQCGADRYLLKHETADPAIYAALHPCGTFAARVQALKNLKALGYETGSGFMIGLPGQTLETIAADLLLLRELGCDMAGIGPFLPHPATRLKDQPPGSGELTRRAVALARLLLPQANLPATTSLGVLDAQGRDLVFSCGANVIMKKITPDAYRPYYEIYPTPASKTDVSGDRKALEEQIRRLGKIPV